MNSASLEKWQIERLTKVVKRQVFFLDRLEGRMHQKHFPWTDPLYDRVKKAHVAVNELSIELQQLLARD